jgi:uncharacterized protein (TIGR02246 family)
MKPLLRAIMAAAAALAASAGVASAQHKTDRAAIESVLATYKAALNASDTETVLTLYTADGVFMPQHSLPSVGADAIRAAYGGVFNAIKLEIDFEIDEIAQVAPNWAFVRTRSEGFVTINATGDRVPEANQELFVFTKTNAGEWRIARYIFSTTNPPRQ